MGQGKGGRIRPQAESTAAFIMRWREAVASEYGPKPALIRLALLALSLHVESSGSDRARVRHVALAMATGLARKTVSLHLLRAIEGGWIKRAHPRGFGRAWASFEYELVIPWSIPMTFHAKQRGVNHGHAEARA